ncbi:hypothetical protein ALC62_13073 [Cyphomyrmex costatus]|uniref:DDE Tnp4 domain-containing protein n=1 Tax=Cyphomyrmex costatus TaxID=456900 RepID=A0A151IAW4_9HYME|nr:hypothetical protein ALC62_13073 [Cyphomyrmex costatus]
MKYYKWIVECANIINLRNSNVQKRRIAAATSVIAAIEEDKRRKYKKKKYWVADIFQNRAVYGFYHAIFPILCLEDPRFINYFRMPATEFEELLCLVGPCPNKSGSAYYNYKGSYSIVLLAMCDANYIFVSVDIGASGRQSDGGIFKHSLLGQKLETNAMDLSAPKPLWEDGPDLPYIIVADEAFPLTPYLLRPYSGKDGLCTEQRIYNYRLSRARRMIENTFGILASQWRIFRKPILASVENVLKIVQATICLHNYLRKNNINNRGNYGSPELVDREDENHNVIPGVWRRTITNDSAFNDINSCGTNTNSRISAAIRNHFCDYFNEEGAVSWQFLQIYQQ